MSVSHRLKLPDPPGGPPQLDASQQAVVDHGGERPVLVLAGPGTGKTTTLVEVVVDRIEHRSVRPEDILVLTFSRKAADELRTRISARLDGTTTPVRAMTFHSYCYGLVRQFATTERYLQPPRLLSTPEAEWRIAELLRGQADQIRERWPEELWQAMRTRGVAREIADFLAKARSLGLEPDDLRSRARRLDRPAWDSLADFWTEYDQVLALAGESDYAGLVLDARAVLEQTADDRPEPALVVVDEYQDTDRAQVELLRQLVGPATELIAVGDPDQSIYAFRGADVRGIWRFGADFGSPHRPAGILPLTTTRRFGPELSAVSRRVIAHVGLGPLSAEAFASFRNPDPRGGDGTSEVATFVDAGAEAEHIAQRLRRAHLEEGIPHDRMAVLARTTESLPRIERALRSAGVPVELAIDDLPVAQQPTVRSLLTAVRAAQAIARERPLDTDEAEALLTGPLGDLGPAELRGVARQLRRAEHAATGQLRDSRVLLAEAVADGLRWRAIDPNGPHGGVLRRVTGLSRALAAAAEQISDVTNAPAPEQILWTLWDGTPWPRRLRDAASAGDDAAHRDLDAMVALFEQAARAQERVGRLTLEGFLTEFENQEIPPDSLAGRGVRGDAVRLMTAHRSKGLEWDVVVVAGVQEGVWPAQRSGGTLLRTERLDEEGEVLSPAAAQLREDRRLFYVAVTRARRHLLVTAVQSVANDGDQPSRFLDDIDGLSHERRPAPAARPRRPLSLRGVVTELRQLAETDIDEHVRRAAAERLADLAGDVPAADPERWWGLRQRSAAPDPMWPVAEPLALSGTAVDGVLTCSLRWFLSREAKGDRGSSTAQGFGSIIHVLAEEIIDDREVDADALVARLDRVWHQLHHDAPWIAAAERQEAERSVRRLVRWHLDRGDRRPLYAEHVFVVEVPVGDDTVRLRGTMDRVEVDGQGRVHVVDFKTGKTKPAAADLQVHPQLGVYQLAVEHGAVPESTAVGGAELVHLRQEYAKAPGLPVVQSQPALDPDEPFVSEQIAAVGRVLRTEAFAATPNSFCAHCDFHAVCPTRPEGGSLLDGDA